MIFLFFFNRQGQGDGVFGRCQESVHHALKLLGGDGDGERVRVEERFEVFFNPSNSSKDRLNASQNCATERKLGLSEPFSHCDNVPCPTLISSEIVFCVNFNFFRVAFNFSPNSRCVNIMSPLISLTTFVKFFHRILANLTLRIPPDTLPSSSKLANLKPRHLICGNPEELVNLRSWEWNKQQNL